MNAKTSPLVDVQDLTIDYHNSTGLLRAVDHVSLEILPGQAYGLIGESGSGKSSLAYALLCHSHGTHVTAARMRFAEVNLLTASERQLLDIRGSQVGMVYQDPMSALNPLMRVGRQITEVLIRHCQLNREQARVRMYELLRQVRFDAPHTVADRLPHQLSGGQQQRVVIAMAIACNPKLLILDEPTTGLDVTTEASILELLDHLRRTINCAVLFISHNLAVVGRVCSHIGVMQAGVMLETGEAWQILNQPSHAYTRKLLSAARALAGDTPPRRRPRAADTLLEAAHIQHDFERSRWLRRWLPASDASVIRGVSLEVQTGTTLGIVGESGSGKSTLARCLAGLIESDAGQFRLSGSPLARSLRWRSSEQTRAVQIVLQNPDAALNPAHTVLEIISRPLIRYALVEKAEVHAQVLELLRSVSLDERHLLRYPHQLSGGQKQRVAIARAFAARPALIICDEPTSALDISVQAELLQTLRQLQERHNTAYILISHDLGVVRQMADDVLVMHQGRIVEQGEANEVLARPEHAYTRSLLDAQPQLPSAAHSLLEQKAAN